MWSVGKNSGKSAFEVLLTRRCLKMSLNPSARSSQSKNLAGSVFGLITNPQDEFLENRGDMKPPPNKDDHPGALPACLYHNALSLGLTLCGRYS